MLPELADLLDGFELYAERHRAPNAWFAARLRPMKRRPWPPE